MLMVMYSTGMRNAELRRLHVRDIDSRRMLIHIQHGKGGRDRYVPLSATLLETLRVYYRWMRPKTWLFPGTIQNWRADKPITSKVVWDACRDAATRAQLEKPVSPHLLRHAYASHLVEAGATCGPCSSCSGMSNSSTPSSTCTASNVGRINGAIRQALLELDATLPYARIETLEEALDPQIRPWRLGATVLTVFGMLAITLALVGLWSSVSYAASQRTNEFAVRLAIGAKRTSIVRLVLGDGIRNAVVAVAMGLFIAALVGGFIADLLFRVSPRDPAIFGAVAGGVLATAAMASLLPAWRAIRIHPAEALRLE